MCLKCVGSSPTRQLNTDNVIRLFPFLFISSLGNKIVVKAADVSLIGSIRNAMYEANAETNQLN